MTKIPDIVPVSELRQDAASVLGRIRRSQQPVVITQRGRAAAVMISIEAYERDEDERAMLHSIARGEQEIRVGAGHDLEDVLADADRLLDT